MSEMVNHPSHYQAENGLEAWDVIKAFTSDLTGAEAWGTQQALKYLLRWKHKNGKEDLEKAIVYIQELIKDIEKNEEAISEPDSVEELPKGYIPVDTIGKDCWDCRHNDESFVVACVKCNPYSHDMYEKKVE